jgi:hypothetical protein
MDDETERIRQFLCTAKEDTYLIQRGSLKPAFSELLYVLLDLA